MTLLLILTNIVGYFVQILSPNTTYKRDINFEFWLDVCVTLMCTKDDACALDHDTWRSGGHKIYTLVNDGEIKFNRP